MERIPSSMFTSCPGIPHVVISPLMLLGLTSDVNNNHSLLKNIAEGLNQVTPE